MPNHRPDARRSPEPAPPPPPVRQRDANDLDAVALLALDASLVLVSSAGERTVPLADYFTGYRETVRRPGELIRAVRLPGRQPAIAAFHKIAKRRYDDISSVAVGFALEVADGTVATARIGLGGVAATNLAPTVAETSQYRAVLRLDPVPRHSPVLHAPTPSDEPIDLPKPVVARPAVATRPPELAGPRNGRADDLKLIKGIGPKIEASLNSLGIHHFDQIASWTAKDAEWIDSQLAFKGRVGREGWVEQANRLLKAAA